MRRHGSGPVPWKSMAHSFIYFFWALDQAQPGKHPLFSFTTYLPLGLYIQITMTGEIKEKKKKAKAEYETSIFKSGKSALKKKLKVWLM